MVAQPMAVPSSLYHPGGSIGPSPLKFNLGFLFNRFPAGHLFLLPLLLLEESSRVNGLLNAGSVFLDEFCVSHHS